MTSYFVFNFNQPETERHKVDSKAKRVATGELGTQEQRNTHANGKNFQNLKIENGIWVAHLYRLTSSPAASVSVRQSEDFSYFIKKKKKNTFPIGSPHFPFQRAFNCREINDAPFRQG